MGIQPFLNYTYISSLGLTSLLISLILEQNCIFEFYAQVESQMGEMEMNYVQSCLHTSSQ